VGATRALVLVNRHVNPLCFASLFLNGSLFSPGSLPLHRLPEETGGIPVTVVRSVQYLAGCVLVVQCLNDEGQVFVGDLYGHASIMSSVGRWRGQSWPHLLFE
jgi:hypothetical protein